MAKRYDAVQLCPHLAARLGGCFTALIPGRLQALCMMCGAAVPCSRTLHPAAWPDHCPALANCPHLHPTRNTQVCAKITNPVTHGYYPVFVDFKRGQRGYCAWHWYGWCSGGTYNTNGVGTRMTFAFHFNLDCDGGCNPGDTVTGHSQVRPAGVRNDTAAAASRIRAGRCDQWQNRARSWR